MSELSMFLATIGAALLILILGQPVISRRIERAILRAGLWINAVDGKEADKIIDWHMKRKDGE